MLRTLSRIFVRTAIICLALSVTACLPGGPKSAIQNAADALKKKDSGAFLAQMDMKAYAAHEFVNLKKGSDILTSLDAVGSMLGLGSQVNDLLQSVMDLENRYTQTFTRTIASGDIVEQCRKTQTPDCPWVPESLEKAEVKELDSNAAVARVTTPANMTSWIALRKTDNSTWRIVGKSVVEETAVKFAKDATPLPAPNTSTQPAIPNSKSGSSI